MKTASMPKPLPAARASPESLRRTRLYMSGLSIAWGAGRKGLRSELHPEPLHWRQRMLKLSAASSRKSAFVRAQRKIRLGGFPDRHKCLFRFFPDANLAGANLIDP